MEKVIDFNEAVKQTKSEEVQEATERAFSLVETAR